MKKIKTTLFIIMVLLIYFSSNCYALTAQTNDYTKYMPTINGTNGNYHYIVIPINSYSIINNLGKKVTLKYPAYINENGICMISRNALEEIWSADKLNITYHEDSNYGTINVLETTNMINNKKVIGFSVGKNELNIQTEKLLLSSPVIQNGDLYFPLRDILKAQNISEERIGWDEKSKILFIDNTYQFKTDKITIGDRKGGIIREITDPEIIENIVKRCTGAKGNFMALERGQLIQGEITKYMDFHNGTVVSADDTWEIGDIDNFIMSHAHKRLPADFRTYVRKLIEDAYLKEKIK